MKEKETEIECPVCLARRDASSSKCWRCGYHGGGIEFENKVPNPYEAEPSEMQTVGNNVLIITLALILLGASSVVPGLMIAVIIVGFVLYLIKGFSSPRKNSAAKRGEASNSQKGSSPVQNQHAPGQTDSGVDILFKVLAAAILLPICVVLGLAIICGGYCAVISIPMAANTGQGGFLLAMLVVFAVAVLLFVAFGKAFLSIFK